MRKLSVLALIGIVSAVVTILATDYRNIDSNVSAAFEVTASTLGPILPALILIVVLSILIFLIRILPNTLKSKVFGVHFGNADTFLNRDSNRYQRLFKRQAKSATSIDVIGIGNSQFSEKEWLKAIDYSVIKNRTQVRVLFLQPGGNKVADRERDEKHEPNWLTNQITAHVKFFEKMIKDLELKHPERDGQMKYRFYDEYPSSNIIIFNHKTAFVQPYFFSLRGRLNPIFYLDSSRIDVVSSLSAEFNRIWKSAKEPV